MAAEQTEPIPEVRRLTCLNGLASHLAATNTRTEVLDVVRHQLGSADKDLPFTLIYLFDEAGRATLACATGVEQGHPMASLTIDPASTDSAWPAGQIVADRTVLTVGNLEQRFGPIPTGGWDEPPHQAVVAPITRSGRDALAGFFVAAVDPFCCSREINIRFINIVVAQIASALAKADAIAIEPAGGGTSMTMPTDAAPLRASPGGTVGAVCAGGAASSRKRLEDRFQRVVEASPSAMIMIRESGQIELVNTQAERVFGYARSELLGQPIEILLPERLRRHHPGLRADFFASPVARPMGAGRDLYGRKKDGTDLPIEIGLSPIETDEGTMILSAVVDLSERVSAAQALAQSEAEFRASFEAAAVGKLLADPSTRTIVRANRAFARMLGREPADVVGHNCAEFTWHEDQALAAQDYERLASSMDDTVIREMRYVRHDGSPFWVRTSATIARTAGSSNRGIVVRAIEDIDTRYKAEAALMEAKQALEQVVEERTDALNQRDLLLREVYHRVKNNLQLVDSLLMMQGRKIVDAQAKEALLSLRGRISALGLVHQQLMGSADLKTFDVVPFLDDLSTNLMEGAGMAGVTISVEACTLDIGLDLAVPLGLLVTELVTNSLKHAFPDGTGTISIILRRDTDRKLTLIVADNGMGQAENDMADNLRSGLGTRIITRLVKQLEGSMTIRRQNGSMTEIRFAMPGTP